MTTLPNNKNPFDIFKGLYDEGSEGSNTGSKTDGTASVKPYRESGSEFKGYLKNEKDILILETLGGGKFKIELIENIPGIEQYYGKSVTIFGTQSADVIKNAVLGQGKKVETKKLEFENRKQFEELAETVKKFLTEYMPKIKNLLTARPGYKYQDGEITNIKAIIAVVDRKVNMASLGSSELLPKSYNNYPIDVVAASPGDYLIHKHFAGSKEAVQISTLIEPSFLESLTANKPMQEAAEARIVRTNYMPPKNVHLEEVTGAMTLVCHVSPEGGWKTLGPFLDETNEHLQVAMYDFSAPHLFDTLKTVLKRGASMKMVYDGNPAANVGKGTKEDDVKEDTILRSFKKIARDQFESIKAWKGNGGICNNAYHIKVAVKDGKTFWLSSGNWQSSNQPNQDFENNINLLDKYNREWNIIVENKKLSEIYYKFIDWDFERSGEKPEFEELAETLALPELYVTEDELERGQVAKWMLYPPRKFVFTKTNPVKIQPILSPDNYIENALTVIKSAKETLYFQNQYIKLKEDITPEYEELLKELCIKTKNDKIDCRIILRTMNTDDTRKMLDDLQAFGFNIAKVRVMTNTHTKGIIADAKTIIIGSHNWSNDGVQYNRDASLLINDEGVAQYYQDVFLHDWERRTKKKKVEESNVILSDDKESAMLEESQDNMVKIDWREYLGW